MSQVGLVIASNRGPLSFAFDDRGHPVPAGSGGGLAAALHPLVEHSGATWVACAMSEADRAAATRGLMVAGSIPLVTVQPDPDTYRMAYDVVANSTLWNCHHHLFDLARRPVLDHRFDEAFEGFRRFNALFATTVAEVAGPGATVLVQDYHLCLVPGLLARSRPDVRVVHFTHTPFADPSMWRVLPDAVGRELLAGLAAADACGFHARPWESGFQACCADGGVGTPHTFVAPLGADAALLGRRVESAGCLAARAALDEAVGDRAVVVRTDRIEPSKNLLRGFWAFDELLAHRRDLRGRVVMLAHIYPSRQSLPEYLAYATEVEHVAEVINDRWGTTTWSPLLLEIADDTDRALAALTRYDVLLVNSVRDGLNLVAKEGPLVNTADGVLALSRHAGAYEELRAEVIGLNPFDVSGTAIAMADALDMPAGERKRRAEALRELVLRRPPAAWLEAQLAVPG